MRLILALALFAAACGAPELHPSADAEHAAPQEGVIVSDGWAPPTPNGVNVSAGFLTIVNHTGSDDRIVAVTSPRAGRVEIHEMALVGAVMQMRPVESLAAAAGQTVTLAPGGLHLMFYEVTQPFAQGETIPVQITFERAGAMDVALAVRPPNAPAAQAAQHGGH